MGLRASELCNHCGVKDVIQHVFIVIRFWVRVFETILLFTSFHFDSSDTSILFGFNYNPNSSKIKTNNASHILVITKLCVSQIRYGQIKNINLIFDSEHRTINLEKNIFRTINN